MVVTLIPVLVRQIFARSLFLPGKIKRSECMDEDTIYAKSCLILSVLVKKHLEVSQETVKVTELNRRQENVVFIIYIYYLIYYIK